MSPLAPVGATSEPLSGMPRGGFWTAGCTGSFVIDWCWASGRPLLEDVSGETAVVDENSDPAVDGLAVGCLHLGGETVTVITG